ncbi:MAG: hypothetical protein WDZ93_03630 [Candidatus Paceibacterota bacterium]
MYKRHIGRVTGGNPAKRKYELPIPYVRRTDRAYVPNDTSGVYCGDPRRLIPSSRKQVGKLNQAVQKMCGAVVCFMDLPENSRYLSITLALDVGYTDYESRWAIVEEALTSAFSIPIHDTVFRPKRRSIRLPKRRKRTKRSAA